MNIAVAVAIYTFVALGLFWTTDFMKEIEIQNNGEWQVCFHDLSAEQADKVSEDPRVLSSNRHENNQLYDVKIALIKVNRQFFQDIQNLADEIEMSKNEDNISYHFDLLEFYGLSLDNTTVLSIRTFALSLMALLLLLLAYFIYTSFALTYLQKRREIGLLSCVYASPFQKFEYIMGEAGILGGIGLGIGLLIGTLGFVACYYVFCNKIENLMNIEKLRLFFHWEALLLAVLVSIVSIVFGALRPALSARKVQVMDLLNGFRDKSQTYKYFGQIITKRFFGMKLALRNIFYNYKRTISMVLLLTAVIVMAINGYVYQQIAKGTYFIQDRRTKTQADAWITIFSDDEDVLDNTNVSIYNLPETSDSKLVRVLHLGDVLFDKSCIRDDLLSFRLYGLGAYNPVTIDGLTTDDKSYYGVNVCIIGIEERLFLEYIAGIEGEYSLPEDGVYPAIVEDYVLIQDSHFEEPSFQSILKPIKCKTTDILFGKYGDLWVAGSIAYADTLCSAEIFIVGTTKEASPVPILPDELYQKMDGYNQNYDATINIYMPMQKFNQFLREDSISAAYGRMPAQTNSLMYRSYSPVENYVFINSHSNVSEAQLQVSVRKALEESTLKDAAYNNISEYSNESNAWEYGNKNILQNERYRDPSKILKLFFITGSIVMALLFALIGSLNYVRTRLILREREFSVLRSLGMNSIQLFQVQLQELLFQFGVAGVIGAIIGGFLMLLQFLELRQQAAIEILIPWNWIGVVYASLVLVLIPVALISMLGLKSISIAEALKNENL
ncbi:MAG: ABC transporter permease [Lachnospiraceae bacterium]|nr:ABC transporter permease [Lachnospiraceae bacterium]